MRFLQMSFYGAVLILAVVLIRAVALNKLPKRTFLALWGVAVFRLLCPLSFSSVYSIYSIVGKGTAYAGSITEEPAGNILLPVPAEVPGAVGYAGEFYIVGSGSAEVSHEFPFLFVVWIAGMLAVSMFFLVCYIRCRREFSTALPVENGYVKDWLSGHQLMRPIDVRVLDQISSPLTYGTFRPVILLPKKLDWDDEAELDFILTHEYVHIRSLDSVKKLLLSITSVLHWFNPLVWVMYVLASRDIELCCDECVLRQFGIQNRSAYSMMLLRLEEKRRVTVPLCSNFSKNAIEERIESIMKFKKSSVLAVALAVAMVGGTTAAFATEAQGTASVDEAACINDDGTIWGLIRDFTIDANGSWINEADATFIGEIEEELTLIDVTGEAEAGDVVFSGSDLEAGVELLYSDSVRVLGDCGSIFASLEAGMSMPLGIGDWKQGQEFVLTLQAAGNTQLAVQILNEDTLESYLSETLTYESNQLSFAVPADGRYRVTVELLTAGSAEATIVYSLDGAQPNDSSNQHLRQLDASTLTNIDRMDLGSLISVSHDDENKFIPEEWAEILDKIENGELHWED